MRLQLKKERSDETIPCHVLLFYSNTKTEVDKFKKFIEKHIYDNYDVILGFHYIIDKKIVFNYKNNSIKSLN